MVAEDIRWYKGVMKCRKLPLADGAGKCPMGKAMFEALEDKDMILRSFDVFGDKFNHHRIFSKGEKFVAPVRLCWRKKKVEKNG